MPSVDRIRSVAVVFALVFLCLASSLHAEPALGIASGGLMIREKPDAKARVLMTAPQYAILDVKEEAGSDPIRPGIGGVWVRVSGLEPWTGNEVEGFVPRASVFRLPGMDGPGLLEHYLMQKSGIVVRRSHANELHWTLSVRIRNGSTVSVFSNSGSEDMGAEDFYLADAHQGSSWLVFRRRNLPEAYLVDQSNGRAFSMPYANPFLSADGSAVYDLATGGMFGNNLTVYDLKTRTPVAAWKLEEKDLSSWDRFACAWRDGPELVCTYAEGETLRSLRIHRMNGRWSALE